MNCILDIPGQKVLFIHVPKNGGCSIRGLDDKPGIFKMKGKGFWGPERLKAGEFDDYFKFGFVRNPYARAVSCWHWAKKRLGQELTFHEFLDILLDDSISYVLSSGRDKRTTIKHHGLAQFHPYNCLQFADYIGQVETFQEDIDILCRFYFEIQPKILPHLNATEHEHYSRYYDEATRQVVTTLERGVLDCGYDYEFEEEK